MEYEVAHDGEARSYASLRHTAWHLLDFAKTHETGSLLQLKAASVFYAFTFEAYLNHVGYEEISFWPEIERINYRKKFAVICQQLSFTPDSGNRPFQTIWSLFGLRDQLAHGRTLRIEEQIKPYTTYQHPPHDVAWRVLPWEKLTVDVVTRFAEDIDDAIKRINSKRPNPEEEIFLWNEGSRGVSISIKNEPSNSTNPPPVNS